MRVLMMLLLSCCASVSSVFAQNMEIKDHTGKNAFMEETSAQSPSVQQSPSAQQSSLIAQQILYKAFESVCNKRLDDADSWIIYANLQEQAAEILKTRDDVKYLANVLSEISIGKKRGRVSASSCDLLVLHALIQMSMHGKDALALLTRVASEYPNYGAINQVKARIEAIKELEELAKRTGVVELTNPKDLKKWKSDRLPLKVYIPTDAAVASVPGYVKGDGNQLRAAFEAWQQQSDGILKFSYLSNPEKADIRCGWESDPEKLGLRDIIGRCATTCDKDLSLSNASIKILTVERQYKNAGFDTSWRSRHLKEICRHEVGHSLGLDHSPSYEDVMYYATRIKPLTCLSNGDIESFKMTYRPTDVAASYVEEASELEQRHLDRPAIVQYGFALHYDPNNSSICERLCACLLRVASSDLKRSAYSEAIDLLTEAKELYLEKMSPKTRLEVLESLHTAYQKTGKLKEADDVQKLLDSATK